MIQLQIEHLSTYTFTREVFLEPHTIRLQPRSCWRQRLRHFELDVDPPAAGRADNLGIDNCLETVLWFSGLTDHLRLQTRASVELSAHDPFAFLPADGFGFLPVVYPESLAARLAPYLHRHAPAASVERYGRDVAAATADGVLAFLSELAATMWRDLAKTVRPEGDPLAPAATLVASGGACRDLTELYIDACRAQGLAARFVSGYHESEIIGTERSLHAWAEVYIPGGGWRGYDPSLGLAVGDRHVAVASGPSFADVRPCEGGFRGTGIASTLAVHIGMTITAPAADGAT